MNTLQIPHPPDHDYCIIAVAGERLKGGKPKFLESDKQKYRVIDQVETLRGEYIPTPLILMATGKFLTHEDVFSVYKKSNQIYFFICQKI